MGVVMGLFLSASGVVHRDDKAVYEGIGIYVANVGGTIESRMGTTDDPGIGVVHSADNMTTVLYPDGFSEWDDVSRHLSSHLNTSVFSFHIHDGDLWMLVAFENGNEVAWFNPIPDYWDEISDEERTKWKGDPVRIASLVPSVVATSIERYFCPWTEGTIGANQKAYDDDEFAIG